METKGSKTKTAGEPHWDMTCPRYGDIHSAYMVLKNLERGILKPKLSKILAGQRLEECIRVPHTTMRLNC